MYTLFQPYILDFHCNIPGFKINLSHVSRLEIFPSVLYTLINAFQLNSGFRAFALCPARVKVPKDSSFLYQFDHRSATTKNCVKLLWQAAGSTYSQWLRSIFVDMNKLWCLKLWLRNLSPFLLFPLKCP